MWGDLLATAMETARLVVPMQMVSLEFQAAHGGVVDSNA